MSETTSEPRLTGTEGPGAGVDSATVVMALPWVVVGLLPAAVVVEAGSSVLLALSAPSPLCWTVDQQTHQ